VRALPQGLGVTVEAVYDTAGGRSSWPSRRFIAPPPWPRAVPPRCSASKSSRKRCRTTSSISRASSSSAGTPPAEANKTTIVFALPSTPGSLFKALSVFALRDINLTKLESRPIRGTPWEYLFYVDIDARRDDLATRAALTQLGEFAKWVRVLGTYKAGSEPSRARLTRK